MTDERRQIRCISETNHRQPCTVSPAHVTREVERMERAGWALVARDPADDTVPAMEVLLTFQKAEA